MMTEYPYGYHYYYYCSCKLQQTFSKLLISRSTMTHSQNRMHIILITSFGVFRLVLPPYSLYSNPYDRNQK